MPSPTWDLLATFIIGLLTVGGVYLTLKVNRPKIQAERTGIITKSALSLLDPLNKRIDKLEKIQRVNQERIKDLEDETARLRLWAQMLWRQVLDLGGQPVPFETVPLADDVGVPGGGAAVTAG